MYVFAGGWVLGVADQLAPWQGSELPLPSPRKVVAQKMSNTRRWLVVFVMLSSGA